MLGDMQTLRGRSQARIPFSTGLRVASGGRDLRIDFLRGLALLLIFIDHIPGNQLANFTLHAFGFSDAAELFVILAGFSAMSAYAHAFENGGLRVGLAKVFARCCKIYGAQVGLLLTTLLIVALWASIDGEKDASLAPLVRDGVHGTLRGVMLLALPAYLDILPLYITLLATFPLVRFGMARNITATFAVSFLVYAVANVAHLNIPNIVDPDLEAYWGFNPLAWQLIFVFGAALSIATRLKISIVQNPPRALVALCWAYLAFAFVAQDAWQLWPRFLGSGFPGNAAAYSILGNEPKTFVTPWRLLHVLAIVYLALSSKWFARLAGSRLAAPILACGRHSLAVFSLGCILALTGRLIFRSFGVTLTTQLLVNAVGLSTMVGLALILARTRLRQRSLTAGSRYVEAR